MGGAFWKEFDSQDWEGRRAIFLRILDDPELISADVAFEMLNRLHQDAVKCGERVHLAPVRKNRRDEWDNDDDEEDRADSGAQNLSRLISQFIGCLRRVESVPYPKGELIRSEFFMYFIRRHEGSLGPKLSMFEQAMNPRKKLPRPARPSHSLCPERVTFDVHLAGLVGLMSGQYHTAVAMFELVPAWLQFLESLGLIDAGQHARTMEELRPLHANLLQLMETFHDDPVLLHALQKWPA